jgi:cytochrome c oxidase accessory protein FixG
MQELYEFDQEYRDSLATVDEKGKRIWVYPKKPSGRFHNLRILVSIVLLSVLFGLPFIKVNGDPLMLIDVFDRKFIIFGIHLWPQDFHIVALSMISLVVFIVLFTVVFGRVWCGWACPQTIFMEMVFRKIEYWIEGDSTKQRKLNSAPWNTKKILKKGAKHLLFVLISLLISHTFLSYIIGIEKLKAIVSQPPTENLIGFIALMVFTSLFYMVFSFLREQICISICPYGRLQGVFLGNNSIAVMYDWLRGEPKGRLKKGKVQEGNGDCIDCKLCVHACPTGIDIRNGTQLECVNCTACIDACDQVMDKIEKPRGLIKYASQNSIKEGNKKIFTTRVIGYTVVLCLLVFVVMFMLFTRTDVEATILKVPGQLYQEQPNERISNLYNIQFINKTNFELPLELRVKGHEGAEVKRVGDEAILLEAGSRLDAVFFIEMPRKDITKMKTTLEIELVANGDIIDEISTNFIGPVKRKDQ